MATITVSVDGTLLQALALTQARTTIGRRPGNDVVLDMRSVSAEHAVIVTVLQDFYVEDLDSTNGTRVNGELVRKHILQHQDVIQLARYEIRFSNDAACSAVPAASAAAVTTVTAVTTAEPSPAPDGIISPSAPAQVPVIKILSGPSAGKEMVLTKSLTTIGCPGVQVAMITRRPQGFLITHLEGAVPPLVNGVSIGKRAYPIAAGNLVDFGGTDLAFFLR